MFPLEIRFPNFSGLITFGHVFIWCFHFLIELLHRCAVGLPAITSHLAFLWLHLSLKHSRPLQFRPPVTALPPLSRSAYNDAINHHFTVEGVISPAGPRRHFLISWSVNLVFSCTVGNGARKLRGTGLGTVQPLLSTRDEDRERRRRCLQTFFSNLCPTVRFISGDTQLSSWVVFVMYDKYFRNKCFVASPNMYLVISSEWVMTSNYWQQSRK